MKSFMTYFREWLGMIVIAISVVVLGYVGHKIITQMNSSSADYKYVYSSLLPLVGTWVGVVLAFYFGKENYEVASKKYETIINKLTPEILDDVEVGQIMISKKTMVYKSWDEIKSKSVQEVIDFLMTIDKTRLPVLDSDQMIKYIIHASLLSKPFKNSANQVQTADTSITMENFVIRYREVIGKIITVNENEKLEIVRQKLSAESHSKDVFVLDDSGNLSGWLTDTLILRYINSKKS